ncbi:MAG: FtsX-like permease family protein, partial [Cyclobacteriaceae bacterium]
PKNDLGTGREKYMVINEKAAAAFGFNKPSEAIGKTVYDSENKGILIRGVVKDYHWEPILKSIRPLALRIQPERYDYIYVKLPGNSTSTIAAIKERWEKYDPAREFVGGQLSEEMDIYYQIFYDISSVLYLVGFLAITITGLGFLGMVSFELQSKVKEIGIRKILGATLNGLIYSMSKGFLKMLVITSLIAFPIAIYINHLWISLMARHAEISWTNVLPAFLIISVIGGLTIVSQVRKNANNNPVDALRSE